MSSVIVSVDPGKHLLGAALWLEGINGSWGLLRAAIVPFTARPADALENWVDTPVSRWDLVVELPQVYRRSRSKAPPKDLVHLATVVGALEAVCPGRVKRYLPFAWKGDVPKPKRKDEPYPIEERCRARLLQWELERVELPKSWKRAMDVWDAVGIGLRHLRDEGLRE